MVGVGRGGEELGEVWVVSGCRGGRGLVSVEYGWGVVLSSS